MRWLRLACCPLVFWLATSCVLRGAAGPQVIVTVTGTVQSGTDGNPDSTPPGQAKVFGGGANLAGEPFTLTLNFNASKGTSTYVSCPDGSVAQSSNVGGDATAGTTAVLQIGGGSFSS